MIYTCAECHANEYQVEEELVGPPATYVLLVGSIGLSHEANVTSRLVAGRYTGNRGWRGEGGGEAT